VAEMLIAEQL